MDYAEAMEHGMGGGDPDYGEPTLPADLMECRGCDTEWREHQLDADGLCEDCR